MLTVSMVAKDEDHLGVEVDHQIRKKEGILK